MHAKKIMRQMLYWGVILVLYSLSDETPNKHKIFELKKFTKLYFFYDLCFKLKGSKTHHPIPQAIISIICFESSRIIPPMFCFFVSNSLLALSSLKFLSSVATHSKSSKSCFYMCTCPLGFSDTQRNRSHYHKSLDSCGPR